MALLDEILKWTESELTPWQRDAARRLFQQDGQLSDDDYAHLYGLLKAAPPPESAKPHIRSTCGDALAHCPKGGRSGGIENDARFEACEPHRTGADTDLFPNGDDGDLRRERKRKNGVWPRHETGLSRS